MKELKCPHCGNVFQVDDDMFESIAGQVRTSVFNEEVETRLCELKEKLESEARVRKINDDREHEKAVGETRRLLTEKEGEIALLKGRLDSVADKTRIEMSEEIGRRDAEIARLKEQLSNMIERRTSEQETLILRKDSEHRVAMLEEERRNDEKLRAKDVEIAGLKSRLEAGKKEAEAALATLREQHAVVISQKDREIQYHKDFKSRLSTKMLGETLEKHCQNMFNRARSQGMFATAYFEKDNDASGGTKGDFIFRDFIEGEEYISIMFEMKNEDDKTATKHHNEDFFQKLDKDRREKGCEYAVLVSMLEADNDLYNEGIVDVSYRYPKMMVVRPQFFMAVIVMLSQAARRGAERLVALTHELEVARAQTVDVTNFERRRDQFVQNFSKLVEAHLKKQDDALAAIDKAIEQAERQADNLRKVKALFETSRQKLVKANETAENDFTIKKLTRGNPTMRAKFEEARKIIGALQGEDGEAKGVDGDA